MPDTSPSVFLQLGEIHGLSIVDRLAVLLWWYHHNGEGAGVDFERLRKESNKVFPLMDSTRERRRLARDTRVVAFGNPQKFRLSPQTIKDFDQKYLQLLKKKASAHAAINSEFDELKGIHPQIKAKCTKLYTSGNYVEAVEKSFKVVRDRLRDLTGHERGSEAFGKGKLHIRGAAAPHVDEDFNNGAKYLTMAIDMFRNEKAHTSDAKINDPIRAQLYLMLSSLAMSLLDEAEILP